MQLLTAPVAFTVCQDHFLDDVLPRLHEVQNLLS